MKGFLFILDDAHGESNRGVGGTHVSLIKKISENTKPYILLLVLSDSLI